MMPQRQCPSCKSQWYSANACSWRCSKCGVVLGDEHNFQERRSEGENKVVKFHGKKGAALSCLVGTKRGKG